MLYAMSPTPRVWQRFAVKLRARRLVRRCGAFPNLNKPYDTDFKACRNLSDCVRAMGQPMRWAGQAVFDNIRKHAGERATN